MHRHNICVRNIAISNFLVRFTHVNGLGLVQFIFPETPSALLLKRCNNRTNASHTKVSFP